MNPKRHLGKMPQSLEENLGAGEREGPLTEGQLDQGWGAAGRKVGCWLPIHPPPAESPGHRTVADRPAGALAASPVLEMTICYLFTYLFIYKVFT